MKIAFDAKRAFKNSTGLGNYSRTLLHSLSTLYPDNTYELYTTEKTSLFPSGRYKNISVITPVKFPSVVFRSAWRSKWVVHELIRHKVDLYHGLSHEIPKGIEKTGIRTVVTIHDLIHELYPEYYSTIDRKIYSSKFKHACENANRIIAISENTKNDIVKIYNINPDKINVIYQAANNRFSIRATEAEKEMVRKNYNLPGKFILSVGSVIQRKNLLQLCKALNEVQDKNIKLIVVGDGKEYKNEVKSFLNKNNISGRVIFLNEKHAVSSNDLPVIYQLSQASVYISSYEGFGLPVLEGLMSGIPVIASNLSSISEAGGNAPFYVHPENISEIANAINQILDYPEKSTERINEGIRYAEKFSEKIVTAQIMDLYKQLVH